MKINIIERNKLLFSIGVCLLLIMVSISSVSGKKEIYIEKIDDNISVSSLLPSWLLRLANTGSWQNP